MAILGHARPYSSAVKVITFAPTAAMSSSVSSLRQQIASVHEELNAAKAAVRQNEQDALYLETENSKVKARIHLAKARQKFRRWEMAYNTEMVVQLQEVVSSLSTRNWQIKFLTIKNKAANRRMIPQIKVLISENKQQQSKNVNKIDEILGTFPINGQEDPFVPKTQEEDRVPKRAKMSKMQAVMVRHLPFLKLSRRRRVSARST